MREGPGVTFPAIQGVLNNIDLVVLASNEEQTWFNVRLEDGTEGWIAANLIYLLPTLTPEPTNTARGVIVEVSGTPLATALIGGLPVTATPSSTFVTSGGTSTQQAIPVVRTPGTVTATVTTATQPPRASVPTVTPRLLVSETSTPVGLPTSNLIPTLGGTPLPVRLGYDVLAYCDQFNEVPPPLSMGTTIDVFWGWVASTEAYLQQHINNVIYEVRLDGQLLDNWRLYAGEAGQQADGNWSQYWYVPIEEALPSGMHTVTYRVTWRNAIFDGYEQFGPGTDTEFDSGSCTFEIR
jgi:hypothetical protein